MALADTAKLVVDLRLDDHLSPGIGRVNSSLSGLQGGLAQTEKGLGQVAGGLVRIGTVAATGIAVGIGAAVKVAGDFEAQLNTINTIAKLSDQQLTQLGTGIRETFRETGVPLDELTSAYYDLLSAGVKVTDAQSVLNTAVQLGIGGLATTKEAVDLLTTAINAYGLNASQAAGASDIFAAAVRDGKVTISEINASFADVAPLAAQYGIKIEEIGAAYATLTAKGIPATEVGTQLNRAIIELLKPGPELVQVMEGLGTSFEDLIRQKGLVATLQDVRNEAAALGIPFQDLFGRLEAYKFALSTTGDNQAAFNAELAKMGSAAGETNAQFAEREQGLNFQLGKLKAAALDAGITIGEALIPKIVPLIEKLSAFINDNRGKIEAFGRELADGFTRFADKLQSTDFTGIINAIKTLGEVGQKVVDIFLSLPPGIQTALVTGAAVNRLSGGLVGAGVTNIAEGLLKIVFQRGSTPATPLFVTNVGGIGGTPAAAGGGGVITKLLGIATAVGLGAIIGAEVGNALIEGQVAQAQTFEESKFAGRGQTIEDITHNLQVLQDQLHPDDIASQIALALDIQGVRTTLEQQLTTLEQQRDTLLAAATAAAADADISASQRAAAQLQFSTIGASLSDLAVLPDTAMMQLQEQQAAASKAGDDNASLRAAAALQLQEQQAGADRAAADTAGLKTTLVTQLQAQQQAAAAAGNDSASLRAAAQLQLQTQERAVATAAADNASQRVLGGLQLQTQAASLSRLQQIDATTQIAAASQVSIAVQMLNVQYASLINLQQMLNVQYASLVNLQWIAAKRSTFNVFANVIISASGTLSQISTYAQIREG